ncbi:MAG: O-antigen ligase family protein [Bacillota bacterium]|nr:O-antigen ligase family protein [Bacillota bacterium]
MKTSGISSVYLFALGFFIIAMQGCFYGIFTFIAVITATAWLVFNLKLCGFSKTVFPVYLLIAAILMGYVFGKGEFGATVDEAFKWLLFIVVFLCCSSKHKKYFVFGVYAAITFSAFIGLLAMAKIIPSEILGVLQLTDTVDGTYQLYSLFGYSNVAAMFFGAAIFIGIYCCTYISRPINIMCIILNAVAFYFTYSHFAAFFFIIAAVGYLAYINRKFLVFLAITVCVTTAVILFIVAQGYDIYSLLGSTVISRIIYTQDALKVIHDSLFGIGFGVWSDYKYQVQSAIYSTNYLHNGYLQLALEGGLHCLLIYLCFIAVTVFNFVRTRRDYKSAALFFMFAFILMHSFTDIDMSYGGMYALLGLIASEFDLRPIKRTKFLLVTLILVILLSVSAYTISFYNGFAKQKINYYEVKIKTSRLTASEAAYLYKGAKKVHDAQSMYYFACKWIDLAPRQQEAYDAVYESINRIYVATLDENYITVSKAALYKRMENTNSSMNSLCRYLDRNQRIELP